MAEEGKQPIDIAEGGLFTAECSMFCGESVFIGHMKHRFYINIIKILKKRENK